MLERPVNRDRQSEGGILRRSVHRILRRKRVWDTDRGIRIREIHNARITELRAKRRSIHHAIGEVAWKGRVVKAAAAPENCVMAQFVCESQARPQVTDVVQRSALWTARVAAEQHTRWRIRKTR